MSSILLVGLTDHESAALEIMIGMHWRDWRSITLRRSLSLSMPEQNAAAQACEACVVDLFGLGMRRYTPEHEARLLEFLSGRSAVLLVWGGGGGWLDRQLNLATGQHLAWVTMPYTTSVMRDALKAVITAASAPPLTHKAAVRRATQAAAEAGATSPANAGGRFSLRPPASPAPAQTLSPVQTAKAEAPSAPVPAWRRAMALAEKLSRGGGAPPSTPAVVRPQAPASRLFNSSLPTTQPSAGGRDIPSLSWPDSETSAPAPAPGWRTGGSPSASSKQAEATASAAGVWVDSAAEVSQAALNAVFTVFPLLGAHPLVVLVGRIMSSAVPLLVRVGSEVACVTCVRQGWLASSVPMSALIKMLQTPHVVSSVALMPLPPEQVEEVVRQNFGGRFEEVQKPLDVLAWELVSAVLRDSDLAPKADLSFQLQRFPNFTVLQGVGGLDVQLAAISARMPQALTDLARAFPKHEQAAYRFATLSILAGLATITRLPSAPAVPTRPAAAPVPAPQTTARRGFFKSLLDKLF